MAEALSLGASVVAFVGLAGQVAQGCQYFLTLVDDVKEASEDLRTLHSEVKLFQLTIDNFKQEIAAFETSGFPIDAGGHAQAVQLALEYAEEAIEKLLKFARKISGTKWASLRFAFGKDKYTKLVARVQRASAHISTAQASILLSNERRQNLGTRATHQTLNSLASTIDNSSRNIDILAARLDGISLNTENTKTKIAELDNNVTRASSDIVENLTTRLDGVSSKTTSTQRAVTELKSDFSQRLHGLTTSINAVLSSKFTASTSIVSQTPSSAASHHSVRETCAAIEALHATSDGLRNLPLAMSDVVKESFRGVLLEFYLESQQISPADAEWMRENPELLNLPSNWQSERRIIRQTASSRKYIRHIGIITVQSTTTTFWEREIGNNLQSLPKISTVTHTNLDLNPNPSLLNLGVYFSFIQHGFAKFSPAPEPKLRVYNVVDSDAPIIKACASGNIPMVRWLFDNGKSSPFDQLWGEKSLLDLVLMRIIHIASGRSEPIQQAKIDALVALYLDFVSEGLDPGLPRANEDPFGASPILALSLLSKRYPQFSTQILRLARETIQYSVHDPLAGVDIHELTWIAEVAHLHIPVYELLKSQDEWSISWPLPSELREWKRKKILMELQRGTTSLLYLVWSHDLGWNNLLEFLNFDEDDSELSQILDECECLDEKLIIVGALASINRSKKHWDCMPLAKITRYNSTTQSRIKRRLAQSIEHCLHPGLSVEDTPKLLESIAVNMGRGKYQCLAVLEKTLLAIGQKFNSVLDIIESDLYLSLAIQLKHLKIGRSSLTLFVPPKLYYMPSYKLIDPAWDEDRYSWPREPFEFRNHMFYYHEKSWYGGFYCQKSNNWKCCEEDQLPEYGEVSEDGEVSE